MTGTTGREQVRESVPSVRVGDTTVWGQDRLWAIEQALIERKF